MCSVARTSLPVLVAVIGWVNSQAAYYAESGRYSLTLDAFANATLGESYGEADGRTALVEGEARALGLVTLGGDNALGARLVYGLANDGSQHLGERSLIAIGDFGRFEVGRRRGLPDILTGYGPNNYQFVSAEFGPASGRSLDPDGGLQTQFLKSNIRDAISGLSSLGITSSLFLDDSSKAIYVSPKVHGFLAGLSYSDDARDSGGDFGRLLQSGLTYERYRGQDVWRIGGTYSYAEGEGNTRDLHSLSFGGTATLDDTLTLGASFTYNGDSGLARVPGGSRSDAYGIALSANYNIGAWTYGGFIQFARNEGDVTRPGNDSLRAAELGASYRFSTRIRLYTAVYLYDLEDEGDVGAADGGVLMAGMRFAL